jgi:hypothetical protein
VFVATLCRPGPYAPKATFQDPYGVDRAISPRLKTGQNGASALFFLNKRLCFSFFFHAESENKTVSR